jgi:hypothetical protein
MIPEVHIKNLGQRACHQYQLRISAHPPRLLAEGSWPEHPVMATTLMGLFTSCQSKQALGGPSFELDTRWRRGK